MKVEKTSLEGEEPLFRPPLRVRVEFPFTRQTLMDNGVYFLELILKYGEQEGSPIMIDLRGEIPIPKEEKPEIPMMEGTTTDDQSEPPIPPSLLSSSSSLASDIAANQDVNASDDSSINKRTKRSSPCPTCNKRFSTKRALTQHLVVHLRPEEKDVVRQGWRNICYFCSKRFPAPPELERHLSAHTKETPHKCHKCKKQFSHPSSLATHKHLHNPTTRRPFQCNQCQKSFAQKGTLKVHIKIVHLRIKPFQCPECDYKSGQKCDMLIHVSAVHRDIRHSCHHPTCDKTFSRKGTLRKHEKRVHQSINSVSINLLAQK